MSSMFSGKKNPMVEKMKPENPHHHSSEPTDILVSLPRKRGPVSKYLYRSIPSSSVNTDRNNHQTKSVMKKTKNNGEPSSLQPKGYFSVSNMIYKKKRVGFNLVQEPKTVTEIFVDKNIGEDAVVKSVVVLEQPKHLNPDQILKESASSSETAIQKLRKKSSLKINNDHFVIKDEVDEKGDTAERPPKRSLEKKTSSPQSESKKQKVSSPSSVKSNVKSSVKSSVKSNASQSDQSKKVKILQLKFI